MEIEVTNKLPIKKIVEGLSKLQDTGESATFPGTRPILPNLLQVSFGIAGDYDFPLMFIASRNQVDADELDGSYISGRNQERSQDNIRVVAEQAGSDGLYYPCGDHGGSWQRDNERGTRLSEEQAMKLARQSYLADIENSFDLLMINSTEDLLEVGKVVPLDVVLQRIVELAVYCKEERKRRNLLEVGYEVGIGGTDGSLTSTEKYCEFIEKLEKELKAKGLPMPTSIVGQTRTLTRETEQVGTYNSHNAYDLVAMAKAYSIGLKKHNVDYLDDVTLPERIPANVAAGNTASQYRTEETRAYLKLCEVRDILRKEGLLEKTSSLKKTLLVKAIKTERWRKWIIGKQCSLQVVDILKDEQLLLNALDTAGYYAFNDADVKKELRIPCENLVKYHTDGQRLVADHIKRPLQQYTECYRLKGITSRVCRIIE